MRRQFGFTLLELLAVVAIIALLVALLLPAVQAARESARKVQCANNFKQTALATLNYAAAHGDTLPAVTDRLVEQLPPVPMRNLYVSWRYTILPYLERQALHDIFSTAKWRIRRYDKEQRPTNPAVVSEYLCVSTPGSPRIDRVSLSWANGTLGSFDGLATRDHIEIQQPIGFQSFGQHLTSEHEMFQATGAWLSTKGIQNPLGWDVIPGQGAPLKYITDGLSKTILIGEQAGLPEYIPTPTDAGHGDRFASNGSYGKDGLWWTSWINASRSKTIRYAVNRTNYRALYSFHPQGVNTSLCDGSVRFLNEAIDQVALHRLLTRAGDAYDATIPPGTTYSTD